MKVSELYKTVTGDKIRFRIERLDNGAPLRPEEFRCRYSKVLEIWHAEIDTAIMSIVHHPKFNALDYVTCTIFLKDTSLRSTSREDV